jgi:hypothetical protein
VKIKEDEKMAVFWVVAPCKEIVLLMTAGSTSETSIHFCQTTRHNNPEKQPSSYSPP